MNPCKYIVILFFTLLITACGGGGGSNSTANSSSQGSSVDNQPAVFSFTDQIDVQLNTLIESNTVMVSGLSALVPVSITGGEYSIDGAAFTSEPGFIGDGQSIAVRQMSSSYYSHTSVLNLTIGTFSEIFSLTTRMTSFVPDQVINGDDGIIYLFSGENNVVFRWSIESTKYLSSIVIGVHQDNEILVPTKIALSTAHNRLYLGYSTGAIRYVDLDGSLVEQAFANVAAGVNGLAAVGNFVLAQDGSGAWATHYILNEDGEITDSEDWNYYSQEYAWDAVSSRVYFFRDHSPSDLHYEVIDQATGVISSEGETPYHGDYLIQTPIRVSANGNYILLGSGDIYNSQGLTWSGSIGSQIVDAKWFVDGSLITLSSNTESSFLQRRNASLNVLEQLSFEGQPLGLYGSVEKMMVLAIKNNTVVFYEYAPNDDSDADGVSNLDDDFPLDASASVDTDNDGYPDAWNDGFDQSDSTSGLSLDFYPNDAACYLVGHGDGTNCDYGATVPDYTPDQIVSDGNIIYLLSKENKRVYRWSIADEGYINPFVIGLEQGFSSIAPNKIALSEAHGRLYLGYSTGVIRYIDLDGSLVEQAFANVAAGVNGLAAVGNFVLAQDGSGAWATHYILNEDGEITDSQDWNYYSREYAWDSVNSRVYFFRDDTSPNDLHYEVIDQTTGVITGAGETPYHGDYAIQTPIRVSASGDYILLGSGDIYNSQGVTWSGSIGSQIVDAKWFVDGSLITLSSNNESSFLQRHNASLNVLEQLSFEGQPLGLYGSAEKMIILATKNNTVVFYEYAPNDDSDADGVSNLDDDFPLDASASVDTDNDGYPDAWNDGYDQSDSTSGLSLDFYPNDAACYLVGHGDGAICNYGATVPDYTPDQIVSDGNIIYLLSKENKRVYRWSIADEGYINPFVIGLEQGLSSIAPNKIALSEAHGRLYLGYSTGAVRYIDLNGSLVEQTFANVAAGVNGLAAVGNFVLAQDYSGAWATHYIFNEEGEITDSKDWNRYSSEYAWDAINSRVYFFRDGTSPNDLHYEVIDQTTGVISGEGETPYHGDYFIQPPIRISANGQFILLGSGDIYKSSDMTLHKSLDSNVSDAAWSESLLITIDSEANLSLFNKDTLAAQGSIQSTGTPIKVIVDGLDLMLVHDVAGALTFTKVAIGDHDEDGLPKWWEDLYGLSDEDPLDADLDNDSDGLYNFEEFAESTLPNNADSDEDGINDGDEINLYFTNPVSEDSDADLLNDFDEVFTYLTNPLDSDSDNDGFSDCMEAIQYMTDPNDINSIPPALTTMNESFEEEDIPEFWVSATNSDADWYIDSTQSLDGTQSLRSGVIASGQNSGIKFSTLFAAGTLQFYTKIESEWCCDHLRLYVDGSEHEVPYSSDWESISIELSAGVHEIELRYVKDGSISFGADAVWIDVLVAT